MARLHHEMETPGNFRAALAYVDRVDRGRFSGPRAPAPENPRETEPSTERLDLRKLSEEELAYLERLYERGEDEAER